LVKDGFLAQRSLILTRLKAICLKLEKQLSDLKPSQYLVSGGINQAFIFVSEVIPELVPQLDIVFDKEGSVEKMNQKVCHLSMVQEMCCCSAQCLSFVEDETADIPGC
jgi:hypothetical protein